MPLFIFKFNPVGVLAIYENIKSEVQERLKWYIHSFQASLMAQNPPAMQETQV